MNVAKTILNNNYAGATYATRTLHKERNKFA